MGGRGVARYLARPRAKPRDVCMLSLRARLGFEKLGRGASVPAAVLRKTRLHARVLTEQRMRALPECLHPLADTASRAT